MSYGNRNSSSLRREQSKEKSETNAPRRFDGDTVFFGEEPARLVRNKILANGVPSVYDSTVATDQSQVAMLHNLCCVVSLNVPLFQVSGCWDW